MHFAVTARSGLIALACASLSLVGCDGTEEPPPMDGGDAGGADAAPTTCGAREECDDGLYCNGDERCAPGEAGAGPNGCVAGVAPCDGACDEETDACDAGCEDADGDGRLSIVCGGDDCDDEDPLRFPGAVELCDAMDRDEDCDPDTFGFRDLDGDTFPDAACCNGDRCGSDCDDAQPARRPGLPESCDGLDNDCDGNTDEGVLRTFWPDSDGDGFGDEAGTPMMACNPPVGFVENDGDCDDGDTAIQPLAAEICDEGCMPDGTGCVDENCDGVAQTDCACTVDLPPRACPEPGVCSGGTQTCSSGGVWGACSVTPTTEVCNGSDDDCDGRTDEGLTGVTCYTDADRDGFAPSGAATSAACGACPGGTTSREPTAGLVDCNDDPSDRGGEFYPGAPEVCDRRDNDCSSGGGDEPTEDMDDDGYTAIGFGGCLGGFPKTDCHDGRALAHPGAGLQTTTLGCPRDGRDLVGCPGTNYCRLRSGTECDVLRDYDWDCDGSIEVEAQGTCNMGVACGGASDCVGNGGPSITDRRPENCGQPVARVGCTCGGIGPQCLRSVAPAATLACR